MSMSWKSLDLLRQNLGDVGQGVTDYLKGRQEDTRREEQATQMRNYLSSKDANYDPALAQLAFSGHGYQAGPAIESMAPKHNIVGGQETGYTDIQENPYSGKLSRGEQLIPGNPGPKESIGDFHKQAHAALQLKKQSGAPLTDIEQKMLDNYDQQFQNELQLAGARAGAVAGATQPIKTKEQLDKEARDAAKARTKSGQEATGLGKSLNQTEEKDIEYRLSLQPMLDDKGNQIGWTDNAGQHPGMTPPDPTKPPYTTTGERKAAQRRLDELKKSREATEKELKVKKEQAKPTSAVWQQHPAGFEYRVVNPAS